MTSAFKSEVTTIAFTLKRGLSGFRRFKGVLLRRLILQGLTSAFSFQPETWETIMQLVIEKGIVVFVIVIVIEMVIVVVIGSSRRSGDSCSNWK